MATHRCKAISNEAPTNVVAGARFRAVTNLQDPTQPTTQGQNGIDATAAINWMTPTGERSTSSLQMLEALLAFGIDDAGTTEGPAAKATLRKAVAQAIAPVTLTVPSYLTIQGVPVATR